MASSASGIVVPLLVLAMTGSASAAGIASALGIVPYIVLSLPVGVLEDGAGAQVVFDALRSEIEAKLEPADSRQSYHG